MTTPTSIDDLFEFPSDFPIKVTGRNEEGFRSITLAIIEKHAGPIAPEQITERLSRNNHFLALTYTIKAQNRAQLDAIYMDLTSSGVVLFAL